MKPQEREVLRAAVLWAIARDQQGGLEDEINDVPNHPSLPELRKLVRTYERAETRLLKAARVLGATCDSMNDVGR
jgi:hypothetical protein